MRSRCARIADRLGDPRAIPVQALSGQGGARGGDHLGRLRGAQAEAFERAVEGSDDPLAALGAAYRRFALAHPHLYRLMTDQELRRDLLAPGVEERAGMPVLPGNRATRMPTAPAPPGRRPTAWPLLELANRFPPAADIDAAWPRGPGRVSARQARRQASSADRGHGPDPVAGDEREAAALAVTSLNAASSTRSSRSIGSR